ncbi:MAG: hypothetical protein QM398_01100 [Thermoproteota archaeon]|jgi:hypothetical protein|nr:hypothetical protein [Thermoproteota archaeon]NLD67159.1 hypothetical protein [Thermoproteota archaeon]
MRRKINFLADTLKKLKTQLGNKPYLETIETTNNDIGILQPVTINVFFGCTGGNIWHTVTWYTDVNYYQLAASMKVPIEQLEDITNSIPVK